MLSMREVRMERSHSVTPINCAKCASHSCSICADLAPAAKTELARMARMRSYRAGETVLAEADEIGFVGNVVTGVLRLQKTLPDGRQQIVGLMHPSDMFGRVFSRTSHVAIEAATDAMVCCYNRASFEHLFERFPELEHRMLAAMSRELDAAQDWMLLLATQSVPERLATFLLLLRKKAMASGELGPAAMVDIPISRRDMAAYLGTTVESISRAVQQMARSGIIQIGGSQRFEILDLQRLIVLSSHDPEELEPVATETRRFA
jgi:CRP/FNR family transcriptional regulator, anaerobic regulatory protein